MSSNTIRKKMKRMFKPDASRRRNSVPAVIFVMLCILPFVIFEGIKVGLFECTMNREIGLNVLITGLVTPIIKVIELRNTNYAFGQVSENYFAPSYLIIFLLLWGVIFVMSFIAADRNKNKSLVKDGSMEFQEVDDFNKTFAYPQEKEGFEDAEEDSYEPGNMIISENARYSLEPKNTNTYSCALVVGATGCVDKETEYFNGKKWKKISDYKSGEKTLQFDLSTNEATLVFPEAYIKEPCKKMYHFETKYGINQTLSPEHKVIYYSRKCPTKAQFISAEELMKKQNMGKFHGRFKTNFTYSGPGISLSDSEIKLMLAVIADGTFNKNNPKSKRCVLNLKKERKINQIRLLLEETHIEYSEIKADVNYTRFSFCAPKREKEFEPYWYNCSQRQLELICENILQWDGSIDDDNRKVFSTSIKKNADFVQFVFSACGYRASITEADRTGQKHKTNGKIYIRQNKEYRVVISKRTMVGMEWVNDGRENNIKLKEVTPDDDFKYCFRVPTSALVLRRKGNIFITGNCGKTFTYVKPNILQMNSSYVITDPKGELTRDTGKALLNHGYDVKVFNTAEPQYSCHYNPFRYIRDEQGVATMVNVFLENTNDPNTAGGNDPFFGLAEKNFYLALFYYVYSVYKDQPEKQTFKTIYELYQKADESDQPIQKKGQIPTENNFDKLFRALAKKEPTNPAIGYYATFKKGSAKTKQSILISVGVRMWFMMIPGIANLLSSDDLELETVGDRKTALFAIIKAEDSTFNFLSAMLFTQLFETLYHVGNTLNEKSWLLTKGSCIALRSEPFIAGTPSEEETKAALERKRLLYKTAHIDSDNENDEKFKVADENGIIPWPKTRIVSVDGTVLEEFNSLRQAQIVMDVIKNGVIKKGSKKLTSHVRFMLDEFANIGKIPDFDKKLATFRSLRISSDIIVQSISQLKEMYEDHEGKITSNCSIKILLGANDLEDCEWFSNIMGQTTVRSQSLNVDAKGLMAGGAGGSISDNAQLLMRPEEIHAMKKDESIILVNTVMPLKDKKYSSLKHPRWKETYDEKPDQENNEFQYRRLFFIKQRLEAQVSTVLPPIQNNQPQSNRVLDSLLQNTFTTTVPESNSKRKDSGVRRTGIGVETASKSKNDKLKQMSKVYEKHKTDTIEDKYEKMIDKNGNVSFNNIPKSAQERMAQGIKNREIHVDKETNTIKFDESAVMSAVSDLIDVM